MSDSGSHLFDFERHLDLGHVPRDPRLQRPRVDRLPHPACHGVLRCSESRDIAEGELGRNADGKQVLLPTQRPRYTEAGGWDAAPLVSATTNAGQWEMQPWRQMTTLPLVLNLNCSLGVAVVEYVNRNWVVA